MDKSQIGEFQKLAEESFNGLTCSNDGGKFATRKRTGRRPADQATNVFLSRARSIVLSLCGFLEGMLTQEAADKIRASLKKLEKKVEAINDTNIKLQEELSLASLAKSQAETHAGSFEEELKVAKKKISSLKGQLTKAKNQVEKLKDK